MELGPKEIGMIVAMGSGAIVLAQKALSIAEKAIGRRQNSNGAIQRAIDETRYETKMEGLIGVMIKNQDRMCKGQDLQNERLRNIEENTSSLKH